MDNKGALMFSNPKNKQKSSQRRFMTSLEKRMATTLKINMYINSKKNSGKFQGWIKFEIQN